MIAHYLERDLGWQRPWEQLLGISFDEVERMRDPEQLDRFGYYRRYPLIDLRLTVSDCKRIVAEAGLPEPPKSSCWFCPLRDLPSWARLRLQRPDLFQASVDLERTLNERRVSLGKDQLFMSTRLKPLDIAVGEGAEQLDLFEDGAACTSGYCWT